MGKLINRHTYTYGILEGIGVCIGVPAKRGQTQNTTGITRAHRASEGLLARVAPHERGNVSFVSKPHGAH